MSVSFDDLKKAINQSLEYVLSNLHTATVAKVTTVNSTTINCRPVISRYVDGNEIQLPEFVDVPPLFMMGGSSYTAHPIAAGDYCLLIFTERCFDRWYEGNDFQLPAEYRMHDYSDGFALIGVLPRASAITIPSEIKRVGNITQNGNITRTGDVDMTGDFEMTGDMTINGDLVVNGNITSTGTVMAPTLNATSTLIVNGVDMGTHVHGGVTTGTDLTGGPQ